MIETFERLIFIIAALVVGSVIISMFVVLTIWFIQVLHIFGII